jgi:hypothetical protein
MEVLDGKVLVWLQSAQFVKAKPSVYVLYDKNLDAIYIGESENLQNTFATYVNTDFENDPCKQKTHTYQRVFVENPKRTKKADLRRLRKNMERYHVVMLTLIENQLFLHTQVTNYNESCLLGIKKISELFLIMN